MANAIQNKFKELMLQAYLSGMDVKAQLVDAADYTYSAAHDYFDDVPAAARVGGLSPALTGKTYTNGVFNADDAVVPAVSGDQSENVIVIGDTGTESTSPILCFIDTFASGMPLTPTGAGVQITWSASGIMQL
jgi:hypothetical protein